MDAFFPPESMPSVWCSGCGIGTVVHTFVQALKEMNIDPDNVRVVSGIGCAGKVAEYLNFKSHKVTDGNAITFAADVSAENQESKVVAFVNNADFLLSGAKDLFEAGKKDADILVVHFNNFIYCMTESGAVVNTPFIRKSFNNEHELPFNIPHLANLSNAVYIARWTTLRAGWMRYSIIDGLSRQGLSLIEVASPCLLFYPKTDRIGDATDRMRFFNDQTVIKQYEPTENLDLRSGNGIVLGKFVDNEASLKDV
jgi:2-oxoglutarate ferredoxin oxidoreductase subunit beta